MHSFLPRLNQDIDIMEAVEAVEDKRDTLNQDTAITYGGAGDTVMGKVMQLIKLFSFIFETQGCELVWLYKLSAHSNQKIENSKTYHF